VTTEPGTETEFQRRTSRRSRVIALIIAIVLALAIGLMVVDVVGWSDREQARVVNGVAEASIAARDFGYVPALIVLTDRRPPLRITIHNQGVHTHTFTIDSLGIDVVIPRGTTKTVTLHVPRGGQYEFYCRFHQSFGMRGHIVVRGS
jgi:plastocyanin